MLPLFLLAALSAPPLPAGQDSGDRPAAAAASGEARAAMAAFQLAEGFTVGLYAAEPLLANPVALWVDDRGRVFVAETFRQETEGIPDNRNHTYWIPDDLAAESVEDRAAMYLKHHPEYAEDWIREEERVRLLSDEDGDFQADRSSVFAGGFKDLLDGTGAGVLFHDGALYYACIPHLWLLRDQDGDGVAEQRRSLHYGFGVRVALRGHDLHGLRFGPDGRLYFSVGDRGYNVPLSGGRRLKDPGAGAVFRCDPDGSELEVFHTGLRNPQELAFNDYGDLFTCDNNSDAGDRARLVYLMEGGDCGWRMNYQYVPDRGPWMPERWWEPAHPGQAAFLNPPIANLSSGPSGFTCEPGTGMAEAYRGRFFLCDFLGGAPNSGVWAVQIDPNGAGYRLGGAEKFLWGVLATDADFGPDGALYVCDWVNGWVGTGKGRIYRVAAAELAADQAAAETARLLAAGLEQRSAAELAQLLGHADRRVRLAAQFELAEREEAATLASVLQSGAPRLARLHAAWGLGQLGRRGAADIEPLLAALDDLDPEVGAQAAKVLGEWRLDAAHLAPCAQRLAALLEHQAPRVRYHAAMSLGRLGDRGVQEALFRFLEADGTERFLRHAAVVALARLGDGDALHARRGHPAQAVRLGALLALRRLQDPRVADYLDDADPELAAEAARAVYDAGIDGALPALAAQLERRAAAPAPLLRRAVAASDRLSGAADAASLARYAARRDAPLPPRLQALAALRCWEEPPLTESVLNLHRPRPPRVEEDARRAVAPLLEELLADPAAEIQHAAVALAQRYGGDRAGPALLRLVVAEELPHQNRAAALKALHQLESPLLPEALAAAAAAADLRLQGEAALLLGRLAPQQAFEFVKKALASPATLDLQLGLRVLGGLEHEPAEALLVEWLDRLLAGRAPPGTELEILEAARARSSAPLAERLRRYEESLAAAPPLARWLPALAGGDPGMGRRIFFEKTATECLRCHSFGEHRAGDGEAAIGPDLTAIAGRSSPLQILQSIVEPNLEIAPGYENVSLDTASHGLVVGRLLEENERELRVQTVESGRLRAVVVPREQVLERWRNASPMPMNLADFLTLREMRDLMAFLQGGAKSD